jgi:hypothetical protein
MRLEYCDETLTVDQLIQVLKKYPKHMKVMGTWESTVNEIKEEWIYETIEGNLYIDCDGGFYKESFEK